MKKVIFLLLSTSLWLAAEAQQLTAKPCSTNPVYRFFDFWIGEWDAYGPSGQKGGTSKISLILDSCVILEEWTGGRGYAGKSFNAYNPKTKMWQQTWVDNRGGVTEYVNGSWEKNKMILTTRNEKRSDTSWLMLRMTFSKLEEDKVRQHGESSADGGKTWKTTFDLEYRRRK